MVVVNQIQHYHLVYQDQYKLDRDYRLIPKDYLNRIEHMKLGVLIVRLIH